MANRTNPCLHTEHKLHNGIPIPQQGPYGLPCSVCGCKQWRVVPDNERTNNSRSHADAATPLCCRNCGREFIWSTGFNENREIDRSKDVMDAKLEEGYRRTREEVRDLVGREEFMLETVLSEAEVRGIVYDCIQEDTAIPAWWLLLNEVVDEVVSGCKSVRFNKSPLWSKDDLKQQCLVDCIDIWKEFPPTMCPSSDLIFLKIRNAFRRCCGRVISKENRRTNQQNKVRATVKENAA